MAAGKKVYSINQARPTTRTRRSQAGQLVLQTHRPSTSGRVNNTIKAFTISGQPRKARHALASVSRLKSNAYAKASHIRQQEQPVGDLRLGWVSRHGFQERLAVAGRVAQVKTDDAADQVDVSIANWVICPTRCANRDFSSSILSPSFLIDILIVWITASDRY